MRYSPETQAALEGLRGLKQKVDRADALDKSIAQLRSKMQRITTFVQNADSRITKLPDNNYITLEEQYRQNIFKEFNGRAIMVRLIIMVLIVMLGVNGIVVLLNNSEVFDAQTAAKIADSVDVDKNKPGALSINTNVFVAILYMTGVTVAAVIYSFTETLSPFDDLDEWVSLYGVMFFLTAWLAPVIAAVTCVYFMFRIHPLYALIPIAIVAGMVGCRLIKFMGIGQDRSFTPREQKKLDEAQALDDKNNEINKRRGAAAIAKAAAAAEPTLQAISKEIQDKTNELNALREEIENNELLFPEDIGGIDRIVRLMETGRADTIKEALTIYDRQQADRRL